MKQRMLGNWTIPENEYRATLNGLNMFFGAVLGFVIAGVERLGTFEFAWVLFVVSGIVVSILYVSASKQRLVYGLATLVLILALPVFVRPVLGPGEALPEKLQPALAVWAILVMVVELFPRRPAEPQTSAVGEEA